MVYPTLKAIVREGKIQLLNEVDLPENALLLVTVLDNIAIETLSLGEHLTAGLQDILLGRVTEIDSPQTLEHHLDSVFSES